MRKPIHAAELFPASLFPKRKEWQTIKSALPKQGYVLVSQVGNPKLTHFIQELGRVLRNQGAVVRMLSVTY
jgi:hypothetical protein